MPNRKRGKKNAAVRRIAYEAADAGLLSPELAAGNDYALISPRRT